ncbi:MAG: cadherin repeat domain-containing protein, partial [Verrucomicrobiales bacterium]|nr:cadherin repeat domain-containing protein [Verrucomicrobiales bacterium]
FQCRATDHAGNREAEPGQPAVGTRVSLENHAPTLAVIPDQAVSQGEVLIVRPVAQDPDHDPLTWSLLGSPPLGAQIDPETGVITWVTGEGLSPGTVRLTVQVLDHGVPRLGTTRAFDVRLKDLNATPILAPLANLTVNEGQPLDFVVSATDADLPPQRLTYRFGGAPPAGATLHEETGEFHWRPNPTQGGASYPIEIVVTDDGTPARSSSQAFQILVRDTRSDFVLGLGTTHLQSGATSSIPITLRSSSELRDLAFLVETPADRVSQFAVDPLTPRLATVALSAAGAHRTRVQLGAAPGQSLPGATDLARFRFTADREPGSQVVPFLLVDAVARSLAGEPLTNSAAYAGKAFLIEREPLLDAQATPDGLRQLVLYGHAGQAYEIQRGTMLQGTPDWAPLTTVTLGEEPFARIAPGQANTSVFYRAIERERAPRLRLVANGPGRWRLLVEGQPGKSGVLESRPDLTAGDWRFESRFTLTNAVHAMDFAVPEVAHRYFRVSVE